MKDKATFWKNMSIVIAIAVLGLLLVASYFIPVIAPAERIEDGASYSCCDIVVAMNATDWDLTKSQEAAVFAISETEGTPGQLVRVVGILGLINAMVGAALVVCAVATIFLKSNIIRIASMGFSVAAACVAIAMITLICVYLGTPTSATYPYSFYNSIHAASFVMLAASLFAGVGSWFLGYFDNKKQKQE